MKYEKQFVMFGWNHSKLSQALWKQYMPDVEEKDRMEVWVKRDWQEGMQVTRIIFRYEGK